MENLNVVGEITEIIYQAKEKAEYQLFLNDKLTPEEEAERIIDLFRRWNTAEAERDAVKNAIIHINQILNYIEKDSLQYKYINEVSIEIEEINKVVNN
jgi:hypothetical protein